MLILRRRAEGALGQRLFLPRLCALLPLLPHPAQVLQKFKAKIRLLTVRHYNFEAKVCAKLNRVIRGAATNRKRQRGK
jgi:hypothetical protein